MAFDGFITKNIIKELNNVLIGAKVNKVFEPTKNELVIALYNNGENHLLNLSINPEYCRLCLTNHQKPNPQNALNFCMLLRKYLTNARIIEFKNYDLERTVEIKFESYNELNDIVIRKLYIEIMSRQSNIILTNDNNVIIDTLRHSDSTRDLLPAHTYEFAPITKVSFIELNSFEEFMSHKESFTKTNSLTGFFTNTFIGFSKTLLKDTLQILNINDSEYSNHELEILYNYFKNMIGSFGTNKVDCKKVSTKDYTIFYDEEGSNDDPLKFNHFIDKYYYEKEVDSIFTSTRNSLLKVVSAYLKKVSKKIDNINAKLRECEGMEKYRLYGELITANLYRFDNNANFKEITVENYYDDNKEIVIPLDSSLSIQKNMERYFKRYNKLKNALEIVTEQKLNAVKELDYIESIVFNLSNASNINDLNEVYEEISENVSTDKKSKKIPQKKSQEQKLDTINIDGYTVYVGKNNIQNDYITFKIARTNDVWFHVQKMHGSHVLLKNPDNLFMEEIPENVLFNCAKLAKENSKAATSLNVSVDYCFAKHIKKQPGGKPGMVNYTNFKTIIVK